MQTQHEQRQVIKLDSFRAHSTTISHEQISHRSSQDQVITELTHLGWLDLCAFAPAQFKDLIQVALKRWVDTIH